MKLPHLTDLMAVYAAVVSTLVLIWDVIKWLGSRPRVVINSNAPEGLPYYTLGIADRPIEVEIFSDHEGTGVRGVSVEFFRTALHRLFRSPAWTGFVTTHVHGKDKTINLVRRYTDLGERLKCDIPENGTWVVRFLIDGARSVPCWRYAVLLVNVHDRRHRQPATHCLSVPGQTTFSRAVLRFMAHPWRATADAVARRRREREARRDAELKRLMTNHKDRGEASKPNHLG